jgi:cytochrome b6-f complex iron-sulfur subunit
MTSGRRSLIRWLLGGGIFSSIASFLYPVTRFIMPPNVPEAAVNEVVAGKVQMLQPNAAAIVKFGNKPVLLIRTSETEWKALTAVCSHLNCTVQYKEDTHQIWCACHNGFYDLDGKVVSGPPPKPLDEFVVRIRGDEVVITRGA